MDTQLFTDCKNWGEHFEKESISFILSKFNKVLKLENKELRFIDYNNGRTKEELKKYDLKFGVYQNDTLIRTITFEIKTDKYASDNLFFEFKCSKELSGVFATEADFFVYILPKYDEQNFFICKPKKLAQLLKDNQYHLSYGGEGNRVCGFLMNRLDFITDYPSCGGKLWSWPVTIPEHFGVDKF